MNKLIVRAAEYLTNNSKKEQDGAAKKNKERLEDLETQLIQAKSDLQHERIKFEAQVTDLENSKNESLKKEKVIEERLKQYQMSKEKEERVIQEKCSL